MYKINVKGQVRARNKVDDGDSGVRDNRLDSGRRIGQ